MMSQEFTCAFRVKSGGAHKLVAAYLERLGLEITEGDRLIKVRVIDSLERADGLRSRGVIVEQVRERTVC